MAVLAFPSSPTNGQTVTINGDTYIYRSSITAWDLQYNTPPLHAPSHQLGGSDELSLDQSQIEGLNEELTSLGQFSSSGSILQNIPTPILSAENILRQAAWWIDANHSTAKNQDIENLGWAGPALTAKNGSGGGSDINDATHLDFTGNSYVYFTGTAGNYMSVPDGSELDVVGDIDIRALLSLDVWVDAGVTQRLVAKHGTSGNRSFLLSIDSTGNLQFIWYQGVTQKLVTSTVPVSIPNKNQMWIRVTLKVDNSASGNDATFYTSPNGVTWTQLGSVVTTSGVTSIASTTAPVEIGDCSTLSAPTSGKIYRVQIMNGINGIPVLDADTSVISSGAATSFKSLTGQTVTLTQSGVNTKRATAVTSPCWLLGLDDYIEVRSRWQQHSGTNFAYLPGVPGNYLSIPDSAALDITSNIDIRVRAALDNWTPDSENVLMSKAGAAGQRSWYLSVTTDGKLRFSWSADGTNWIVKESTTTLGLSSGQTKWVRATIDVDNGAGQNEVSFYTSDDNVSYPLLGTVIQTAGTSSIFASTAPVEIGSINGGTSPMTGRVFRALIYQEIGGTIRADIDINTNVSAGQGNVSSFTATIGGTVTVNKASGDLRAGIYTYSGYPVIDSDIIYPSTYSVLDFSPTDSFTVVAVSQMPTYSTGQVVLAKSSGSAGYAIRNDSGTATTMRAFVSDGTASPSVTYAGRTAGGLDVQVLVRDKGTGTIKSYYNRLPGTSTTDTTTESIENKHSLRIGRFSSTGTNIADMKFYSAAVFRRVLTEAELTTLALYFEGRIKA